MNWRGKRVLVTGAGGFIGSHLTESLVSLGADVRALVHYRSDGNWGWLEQSDYKEDMEVMAGDIRDRDSVTQAMDGRDIVFHLAALIAIPYSYQAPESYVDTNIKGTMNVFQSAIRDNVERVVHTSTSEVYGTARYVPIDEDHPLQGQSPYSASKIAADKQAEAFHLSFGLPVVTVRPFNTYGPRQSARAVIPTIITQALTSLTISLGSLDPTRDFNYVADTVRGFLSAARSPEAVGEVINLGTGTEVSIGHLSRTVLELVGKPEAVVVSEEQRLRPKNSEVERLCADAGKALRILNWSPELTLEQGLGHTIEWLRSHLDRYRPGVYAV